MADELDFEPPENGDDMGTVVLMLSLYLIVLAFFILLNAISESNPDKVEAALKSVGKGFTFASEGDDKQTGENQTSMVQVFHRVSQRIKGVLQNYLELRDFDFRRVGNKMEIHLNKTKFMEADSLRIKPEMVGFFEDMSDSLAVYWPGMEIMVTVTVHTADKDKKMPQGLSTMEFAGQQATLFTRALVERGAPDYRMAAAVIDDEKDEITITFDVLVQDENAAIEHETKLNGAAQ